MGACSFCGTEDALQFCSRCRRVLYCSARCQRNAWKLHKNVCVASGEVPAPLPAAPTPAFFAEIGRMNSSQLLRVLQSPMRAYASVAMFAAAALVERIETIRIEVCSEETMEHDVVFTLLATAVDHRTNKDVVGAALTVLTTMAHDAKGEANVRVISLLAEFGGAPFFLSALREFIDAGAVYGPGVSSITQCIPGTCANLLNEAMQSDDAVMLEVSKRGGGRTFVAVVKAGAALGNARVCISTAQAIASLAAYGDERAALIRGGAVAALVDAVSAFLEHPDCSKVAHCAALGILALRTDPQCSIECVSRRGLASFAAALSACDDPDSTFAVVHALTHFFSLPAPTGLCSAEATRHLVRALQTHGCRDPAAALLIGKLLIIIVQSEVELEWLAAADGISVLLQVLHAHAPVAAALKTARLAVATTCNLLGHFVTKPPSGAILPASWAIEVVDSGNTVFLLASLAPVFNDEGAHASEGDLGVMLSDWVKGLWFALRDSRHIWESAVAAAGSNSEQA